MDKYLPAEGKSVMKHVQIKKDAGEYKGFRTGVFNILCQLKILNIEHAV